MTDEQDPLGDEPPIPPLAGGADPTLPGGADPTMAQPTSPNYTTGPGAPPPRDDAGTTVTGPAAGGGAGVIGPAPGGPPPWLLPAAGGAVAAIVIGVLAFFLLRDDGDDGSIASGETTTTEVAPTTTLATETTVATDTTVASETTIATDTTVAPETTLAPETTVAGGTDGGGGDGGTEPTDPCAGGYTEVDSLPFDLCSQGDVVIDAQLTISQFTDSIEVDGFYGAGSFAAVQELQSALGLPADGIVSQAFLDALTGTLPPAEFPIASPGTVNIGGSEFPIIRTCRTIPFEGRTADYQVISYVFQGQFGEEAIDRWFDEGGVSGIDFGDTGDVTDLSSGFGFELFEGDGSVLISVNPTADPSDTCAGTVTEQENGEFTRTYSVTNVCTFDATTRLTLSEEASIDVVDTGDGTPEVTFSFFGDGDFYSGSDPDATSTDDPARVILNATVSDGSAARALAIDYDAALITDC